MTTSTQFIFDLSAIEKLQLVEAIWDNLAENPQQIPVYQWQLDELAARRINYSLQPPQELSWDQIAAKVRERNAQ